MKNGLPSVSPCSACTNAGSAGGDAERHDQLGDLRLGEAAELDPLEQALAADVADQLVQRVAGLDLGVAVGAERSARGAAAASGRGA